MNDLELSLAFLPDIFPGSLSGDLMELAVEGGTGGKPRLRVEFIDAFVRVVVEGFQQMVYPIGSDPEIKIHLRLAVEGSREECAVCSDDAYQFSEGQHGVEVRFLILHDDQYTCIEALHYEKRTCFIVHYLLNTYQSFIQFSHFKGINTRIKFPRLSVRYGRSGTDYERCGTQQDCYRFLSFIYCLGVSPVAWRN